MIASFESEDFTYDQFVLGMEVCAIFWAVIPSFGVVTNLIIIRTFIAIGLNDGMTASFLILSIMDLNFSIVSLGQSVVTVSYVMEAKSDFLYAIDPYSMCLLFATIIVPVSAVISLQTCFVAMARCLCVALPFYFKNVFTRQVTLVFLITCLVISASVYVPVFLEMGFMYKFDPKRNITRPTVWLSERREKVKGIIWTTFVMVIPLVSQLVVFVSLVVMARSLRNSYRFRLTTSSALSSNFQRKNTCITSLEKGSKLADKEIRIVQQVALISAVYIACHVPKVMFIITGHVLPEFNINRGLNYLYLTVTNTRVIFEMINSAVNFPIYYKYNSKFRNAFLKLLHSITLTNFNA